LEVIVVTGHELRYLMAIVCLYSFSEFLLKRLVWKPIPIVPWARVFLQSGVLLIILFTGTLGFSSWQLVVGYLIVVALRALWDGLLWRRVQKRFLESFIITQIITMVLLAVVWDFASPLNLHGWYTRFETETIGKLGAVGMRMQQNSTSVFLILSTYFFMVDGGARIVRGTLNKFPVLMAYISSTATGNNENRGEWIGVFERIITLTFVLTGNYTAVAFALTAKSIARFKELDNKDFAEYYLLGTSVSVATTLLAGSVVRFFL
jgi:hypothetical protein